MTDTVPDSLVYPGLFRPKHDTRPVTGQVSIVDNFLGEHSIKMLLLFFENHTSPVDFILK